MSNTVATMAREFVKMNGRKLSHRSVELRYPMGGPVEYRLYGNVIATITHRGAPITFNWCGWYGPTTANHINNILRAAGKACRVSYAQARKDGQSIFTIE